MAQVAAAQVRAWHRRLNEDLVLVGLDAVHMTSFCKNGRYVSVLMSLDGRPIRAGSGASLDDAILTLMLHWSQDLAPRGSSGIKPS